MIALIAGTALLAGIVGWAVHQDIERAEARRRTRARLGKLGSAFRGFQVAISTAAFLPSMQEAARAAAEMEKAIARASVSINADTSQFTEALRKFGEATKR